MLEAQSIDSPRVSDDVFKSKDIGASQHKLDSHKQYIEVL